MFKFPPNRDSWRLDIVSILAVLGESNIKIHALNITASRIYLLPRLLPAPQALLREVRPKRLPFVEDVDVFSVNSGAKRSGLDYISNLIHQISSVPSYYVIDVSIDRGEGGYLTYMTWAPLNQLAIGSCLLSIGLLIWSALLRDGVAFIAILIMSFASSALGFASLWRQKNAMRRSPKRNSTDALVLRTRWGAFVIVHCEESISRELYFSSEECEYVMSNVFSRAFGGVIGGLGVLIAVVLFGNCSWVMQAAIGSSYALLNFSYWLITVIPEKYSWDLSAYSITVNHNTSGYSENFTHALSRSIKLSGSAQWARTNNVIPESSAWRAWLDEAERNIDNDVWDPQQTLTNLLNR